MPALERAVLKFTAFARVLFVVTPGNVEVYDDKLCNGLAAVVQLYFHRMNL